MNKGLLKNVSKKYNENFGGSCVVTYSPGRVNIIGEHTDYNNGFVLPAAINKGAYAAAGKSGNKSIKLHASAFNENYESDVEHLLPTGKGWPDYILGVAEQLIKRGFPMEGFNLVIDGDVPPGSGMSSSAAVECSTLLALKQVFELNIPDDEMAFIAQKAEHEFVGVQCGIMDQFASLWGKRNHVIKLDCRSMDHEYIPLNLQNHILVLLNTNVSHSLGSSEYNKRREQCDEGVMIIQKFHPEVKSLRDVDHIMADKYLTDPLLHSRCTYVIEENERLLESCDHLRQGDLGSLGKLMFKSHYGLSKKYEVSCKELDFLVDEVKFNKNVSGARMMGGGFGGCTINLVKKNAAEELIRELTVCYKEKMGRELSAYIAETSDGGAIIQES